MARNSTLRSVECFADGRIAIHLSKQIEDGGDLIHAEHHHFEIPAAEAANAGLLRLKAYLELNGWPDVPAAVKTRVQAVVAAARNGGGNGGGGK